MPVFLDLFHGRTHPDEELDDWGEPGPVFGPFKWIHTTYGCDLKLGDMEGFGEAVGELAITRDGLVYYDGMLYGDWSIFTEDTLGEDEIGRLARFIPEKARLPFESSQTEPKLTGQSSHQEYHPVPKARFRLTIVTNELFEVTIHAVSSEEAQQQAERFTAHGLQTCYPSRNIDWQTAMVAITEEPDEES